MRSARQDQALCDLVQLRGGDGLACGDAHLLDHLAGQGVDQPGLPGRQLPGPYQSLGHESPARLGAVLGVEARHLLRREIAQA